MHAIPFKELVSKEHQNTPTLQIPTPKLNIFDDRKHDSTPPIWTTTKKNEDLFLNSSKKRKLNIGSSINETKAKEGNLLQRINEQSGSAPQVGSVIPQYVAKQKQLSNLVREIVNSIQICNQQALTIQDEKISEAIQQFETEFQSYIVQINK